MATTIVKGHGFDPDGSYTFVPDGMTIRMYTAHTVNLKTNVALIALLDSAGDPGQRITKVIHNYELGEQDDQFHARWLALAQGSGVPIMFIDASTDGIRLCGSPDVCKGSFSGTVGDDDATRAHSWGDHRCTGLLGRLAGCTDVAIVACRGSESASHSDDLTSARHVSTAYDEVRTDIEGFLDNRLWPELTSGDPARIAAMEQLVDGLPQGTLALLGTRDFVKRWNQARQIRDAAERNDLAQVFGQLRVEKDGLESICWWLTTIPAYGAELDRVATQYAGTFGDWLLDRETPSLVALQLEQRPAIRAALDVVTDTGTATTRHPEHDLGKALSAAARNLDHQEVCRLLAGAEPRIDSLMDCLDEVPGFGRSLDALAESDPVELFDRLDAGTSDAVRTALETRRPALREARRAQQAVAGDRRAVPGGLTDVTPESLAALTPETVDELAGFLRGRLVGGDQREVTHADRLTGEIAGVDPELLAGHAWFATWKHAREVGRLAAANRLDELFPYLVGLGPDVDDVVTWTGHVPQYGTALDAVATSYPGEFLGWARSRGSDRVLAALRTRRRIDAVFAA